MNAIFLKTALLAFIPMTANLGISFVIRSTMSIVEFNGWFNGSMTGLLLSLVWFLMVRISMSGEDYNLLKIMIRGFIVKFVVLAVCISISFLFFEFDRKFFVFSFFIGIVWPLVVEVWFYLAVNRLARMKRGARRRGTAPGDPCQQKSDIPPRAVPARSGTPAGHGRP